MSYAVRPTASIACCPSTATSKGKPPVRRISATTSALMGESSTRSTRGGPSRAASTTFPGAAARVFDACALSADSVNQKVDPSPARLSTPISPPIRATSSRQMASPSPEPPCLRVDDASACENGKNSRPMTSGAMPAPLSCTSTRRPRRPPSSSCAAAVTTTSPLSANFTALPTRLVGTWRSRAASPTTYVDALASGRTKSESPFISALSDSMLATSTSTSGKKKGLRSSSSLPASIFEKSRMSLMTESSSPADVLATSTYRRCRSSSTVRESRSTIPMTPLSGVRSSWLMLATKALLAALAAIASSLARPSSISAARRSSSRRRRSVTSRAMICLPTTRCCLSRTGERTPSTCTTLPSFRVIDHSTGPGGTVMHTSA
jgi:hypothetical protein